ncbi:MAG: hypothetical protein RIQ89_1574 [Bacteroidota bacterium]|jgi:Ca-activated chloride channel homolog
MIQQWWNEITFYYPYVLWALIGLPLALIVFFIANAKFKTEITFSSIHLFSNYRPTIKQRLLLLPFIFKLLAIGAIIIALARPQSSYKGRDVTTEGIDLILAIDVSASMLAEDLKPNRIEAAKKVAIEFIDARPNDRIGLVIFSGESFTQCPITSDHAVLKNLFAAIESGSLADGTAIGEGLATAVNRLRTSKAKSKVVVLLTDGVNNIGDITPITAGEIAKAYNVRVYTVGAGSKGTAPYPFKTPFGIQYQQVPVDIDEGVLKQIAADTGGKYFRATNATKLKEVYAEIDKLEKTKVNIKEYSNKNEEFLPFALLAIALVVLAFILQFTLFKSLP